MYPQNRCFERFALGL